MEIRNILLPTDFSESAGRALPHALALAARFDAQITVLHVQVPYANDPKDPHYFFFNEDQYAEYVEDQVQQILDRIEPNRQVSTAVSSAVNPALGILHYLERNPVDALVMGSHGHSALGRFFLGSVTEKVVRHARCPVLTVACQRENCRNNPSFRKILAAFDFSEHSIEAVRHARELARRYEADLQVLYVLTQQIQPRVQKLLKNGFDEQLPELAALAREALSETLKEQGLRDLNTHVEVGESNGRASEGIVNFARKTLVDLIVIGRHGLTGIEKVLLGSTTERVVRTAPCPVLTIHKTRA